MSGWRKKGEMRWGREYSFVSSLLDHFLNVNVTTSPGRFLKCVAVFWHNEFLRVFEKWFSFFLQGWDPLHSMLELAWGFSVMCSCPLEGHRMESDQLTMILRTLVFHHKIWKPYKESDERHEVSYEEQNVSHPWRVLKARKVRGPKLSGLPLSKDVQGINSA